MSPRFAVGIDLGTTNSVVAYSSLEHDTAQVELLPLEQLTAPMTIENRTMLPSFCYQSTQTEIDKKTYDLPWAEGREYVVGEAARRQAADTPNRTIAAAKSWLAHTRVDRRSSILPWNGPADVKKVSPVEVSSRYLEHMVSVWANKFPDAPISEQYVVLTVPASFDASARELTMEAAIKAGLPKDLVLLEEPQAALYAWIDSMGDKWRQNLSVNDTILVCDIGGGTSDFSLFGVIDEDGQLELKRIAVGNHILVGGDNMDLTLAHYARTLFESKGHKLDAWQSVSLWHACRLAKENLLSENPPETFPVTILGRGSKLIGNTITIDISEDQVRSVLLDGFFPKCDRDASPARKGLSGFKEIGLPFEADTAITKHLAAFLRAHGEDSLPIQPNKLLYNGGVFKSKQFRDRTLQTISNWFTGTESLEFLEGSPDYDHAVARGASFYGFSKRKKGIRIRGGTARSYYIGIEVAAPAVPGVERPLHALCVVPYGMEEGTALDVPSSEIGLVVGEEAIFRFFSSSVRTNDKVGDIIEHWEEGELEETDSLESHLPVDERFPEGYVPVKFHAQLTELGIFELSCKSMVSDDLWKLQFSVREKKEDSAA